MFWWSDFFSFCPSPDCSVSSVEGCSLATDRGSIGSVLRSLERTGFGASTFVADGAVLARLQEVEKTLLYTGPQAVHVPAHNSH